MRELAKYMGEEDAGILGRRNNYRKRSVDRSEPSILRISTEFVCRQRKKSQPLVEVKW